jgi:HEAT repeat protein
MQSLIALFLPCVLLSSALLAHCPAVAAEPPPPEFQKHVANLIRQLGADKFQDREAAARDLEAAGPAALDQLRQATKSTDLEIARRAADIIPIVERNAEIAALIQIVAKDPESSKRWRAAEQLGYHGKHAAAAFPVLLEAVKDEYPLVRYAAVMALARVDASRAIPKLIDIVKGPLGYDVLACRAAVALGEIGSPAVAAVPALVEALGSKEKVVRREAAHALGLIGGDHPKQVSALLKALDDAELEVRLRAVEAVGRMKRQPADCVPALIELLKKQKPPQGNAVLQPEQAEYFRAALQALGQFGSDAKDGVPTLLEVLRIKNYINGAHLDAIAALERIGPGAKEAVPLLQDLAAGRLYDGVYAEKAERALQAILKPQQ